MGCSNILTLTGLPYSGKTTIGNSLAQKLGFTFIDLDNYITTKYKNSIAAIFKLFGEKKFRKYEEIALAEIIKKANSNLVLALGGGTICFSNNLNLCLSNSKVIWLNTALPTLKKRLLQDGISSRPLFKEVDASKKLQELYNKRLPFYQQAHLTINTATAKTNYVVKKIINTI